jgi:hypothetical protein
VQAAKAVYASRYGIYNTSDGSTPRFKNIALKLSEKYGDMLTAAELRSEMKTAFANKIHN